MEQLYFVCTGLSPKVHTKDLICATRKDLPLGLDWVGTSVYRFKMIEDQSGWHGQSVNDQTIVSLFDLKSVAVLSLSF